MSHLLKFSHPTVGTHSIYTGLDQIEWGYELNTANYPTYGGEVIQILSCYIDNVTISGTFETYAQMESFYNFFLGYLQTATQGASGKKVPGQTAYNQQPMVFTYPHRNWKFHIFPLEIPGFRYGREVVAPEWSMRAFVIDPDEDLKSDVITELEVQNIIDDPDQYFGLQGKIGLVDRAWSDPFTEKGKTFHPEDSKAVSQLGDYFSKIIPSYLTGDFDSILANVGSKPSFGSTSADKGIDPRSRQANP